MFQSRGRSPRFPAGRQKFVPRNHSRGSPSSRSITRECCIAARSAGKGLGRVGPRGLSPRHRRFSSRGEGGERWRWKGETEWERDGERERKREREGWRAHEPAGGLVSRGPHPPSRLHPYGEDENLDGHARVTRWKRRLRGLSSSLSSSSSVSFHSSSSFSSRASFGAAFRPSLPSSIVGPRPLLPLPLLLISVRVSSRFTTEMDPGRGGLYLLRLALQIGKSKKISLKKCQYSYIYRVYVSWVPTNPGDKIVRFSCFSESLYRTRFFLFLFSFSSLYSLFLARFDSWPLSLFFFLFFPPPPDSRLNGSRSFALALAGRGLHVVSRYVKFWLACAGSGPGEQPVIY